MGLLTNSLASIDKKLLLPFLLCGVIYITIIHPLFFGPLSRVPGPPLCKITSYYLLFFDFFYARNTRVHQWHQKYGPILCIGPREVSLSSPTHMRTIYTSTSRFDKSAYFDKFTAYGERAMFSTLSYHDHQAKRRMLSSFYQATNIKNASILGFIRERARSFISSLDKERRTKKEVNIFPLVNRFAFDNITRLLYGEDHGTYSLEDDTSSQTLLNDLKKMQFLGPLQINFPILHAILSAIIQRFWPQKAGGFSVAQRLESWNISKIASVTQTSAPESLSLLNRLLSTKDTPNPDSIACELLDNVNAQETVGVALTYFIWHLSLHQKWQDQIRSELKALPITEDGFPSMSNIESAILLEAFLKEVYRVNPGSSGRAERLVPLGGRFFDTVFLPENVCFLFYLTLP